MYVRVYQNVNVFLLTSQLFFSELSFFTDDYLKVNFVLISSLLKCVFFYKWGLILFVTYFYKNQLRMRIEGKKGCFQSI